MVPWSHPLNDTEYDLSDILAVGPKPIAVNAMFFTKSILFQSLGSLRDEGVVGSRKDGMPRISTSS